MNGPVFVTETKERVSDHPWRLITIYNGYPDGTHYDPRDDFPELWNLSAHKDVAEKAKMLSIKLNDLGPHPKKEEAQLIVDELISLCEKPYYKKTQLEKWSFAAIQMPEDIGGVEKEEKAKIISARASGKVLETMCGFNSYFENTPNISKVIAVDFCREMLQRYEYPERTRILYDMERIVKGEKMDFFKEGEFNTIGCWGSNYLTKELPVFKEFYRLLSKGGKLIIQESTTEGYGDIVKRYFNPQKCAAVMKKAGFEPKVEHLSWLRKEGGFTEHYIVEGIKK